MYRQNQFAINENVLAIGKEIRWKAPRKLVALPLMSNEKVDIYWP
jgi:hypothetical protein